MGKLRSLEGIVRHFEELILGVGLFGATVVICANAVARYVFNDSFVWAEELARYVVVWMTFIGMSVCVRKGVHVTMDVLVDRMPTGIRRFVWRLTNGVATVFSLYLAYVGWLVTAGVFGSGQVSAILGLPMWIVYMCVPIGAVLAAKNFALNLFRDDRVPTTPTGTPRDALGADSAFGPRVA